MEREDTPPPLHGKFHSIFFEYFPKLHSMQFDQSYGMTGLSGLRMDVVFLKKGHHMINTKAITRL